MHRKVAPAERAEQWERGSGGGRGKGSAVRTISWHSYPSSNPTFLRIVTKIKTCKESWLSAVSVLKSRCALWMLFAGTTLVSLLNKQKSQVPLLAPPTGVHDSPPTWVSHQHLQPGTEKVGFLVTKTSTNWKHQNTTDYSCFWMKELPRAQGWDMTKSDLPTQPHQEWPSQCTALAYIRWGHGLSSTSLHDPSRSRALLYVTAWPIEVIGLPLPHCVPRGRLTLKEEQESSARRRWMELPPRWELGFPLPCCLLLLDCSGDAAGKLLASLLRICWLSPEPPAKRLAASREGKGSPDTRVSNLYACKEKKKNHFLTSLKFKITI